MKNKKLDEDLEERIRNLNAAEEYRNIVPDPFMLETLKAEVRKNRSRRSIRTGFKLAIASCMSLVMVVALTVGLLYPIPQKLYYGVGGPVITVRATKEQMRNVIPVRDALPTDEIHAVIPIETTLLAFDSDSWNIVGGTLMISERVLFPDAPPDVFEAVWVEMYLADGYAPVEGNLYTGEEIEVQGVKVILKEILIENAIRQTYMKFHINGFYYYIFAEEVLLWGEKPERSVNRVLDMILGYELTVTPSGYVISDYNYSKLYNRSKEDYMELPHYI